MWVSADWLSFVGAVFTNMELIQLVLCAYYVFADFTLVFQWFLYERSRTALLQFALCAIFVVLGTYNLPFENDRSKVVFGNCKLNIVCLFVCFFLCCFKKIICYSLRLGFSDIVCCFENASDCCQLHQEVMQRSLGIGVSNGIARQCSVHFIHRVRPRRSKHVAVVDRFGTHRFVGYCYSCTSKTIFFLIYTLF